jgi:hypothetical protein
MRSLRKVLALSLFTASVTSAFAQPQSVTDVERADLAGPVESVSVVQIRTDVQWVEPGGPSLIVPVWCQVCEFDIHGNQVKSGQIIDGVFKGEISRIRDEGSGITDRIVEDASTGETLRHEVVGRFGTLERTIFQSGKLLERQTFSYDQYGHMIDWITFDGDGKQIGHTHTERDDEGEFKEKWTLGKDGELASLHTFDVKTGIENYRNFNQFGQVTLDWTVADGKLVSFWELPDPPSQYADNFTEGMGNATLENYACGHDGKCELSRIHYDYLDPDLRNPQSAEWSDSNGHLRFAVYYDYDIDLFRNWTFRRVWVWTPALGERKLYETDSRTIAYWRK